MHGFEPEDDVPPPPPRRVSEILRDVVADLDEAILASNHPELSALLRQLVDDAGHVWSTAGNLERDEDRDSQDWEHIADYQRSALDV